MTRILIATRILDEHAITVACALENTEHEVVRWHGADFPSIQTVSCEIDQQTDLRTRIQGPGIALDAPVFDTIWYRRPSAPVIPTAWIHPEDVPAATRENDIFARGVAHWFNDGAVWINQPQARVRANDKLLQLREARRLGLRIPRSLFGNEPAAIRRFIGGNPGGTIYKTFFPMQWRSDTLWARVNTAVVTADSIPSDKVLALTPGIFQERIAKQFEVRATFMGASCLAMAIDSQADPRGVEDFRRIPTQHLCARPHVLPAALQAQCRALMARLGIVFGSFDFIVKEDGEYVFLEVNEQGQFLWLEQLCPDIPVLDAFLAFLAAPHAGFDYQPGRQRRHFADFFETPRYNALYAQEERMHVFAGDPVLSESSKDFGVQVTA